MTPPTVVRRTSERRPRTERVTAWLRARLGRAAVIAYAAALLLPGPGLWLRAPHILPATALTLRTGPLLLSLVLFCAGLQVPLTALGRLFRRPLVLVAGLALHLMIPLAVVPVVACLLRYTPDSDGGSGLLTAMILTVSMPVAAGATVWTDRGDGDRSAMVGLVLVSTLASPITTPLLLGKLAPLLSGGYAHTLAVSGRLAQDGFAFTSVVMPCAAGLLCSFVLPARWLGRLLRGVPPIALIGSLALTYVNASGALGSMIARPRPLLIAAALLVAALICGLSFALGQAAARVLRFDAGTASSLTLACGMNNSSASAVLISTSMPGKPHLLLPVLAYGLLQKTAANRITRAQRGRPVRS
ncbi:sodium-dependent transporter [Streptomyces sp. NPDC048674]|uniref:sodium-dependent transporter n=1 Tax=Streptomyces sp. NPDC048674 TaxID=3155491 RepID=UPI00341922D5